MYTVSVIRRVAPIRAANTLAVLYGVMMTAMALLMYPVFNMAPMPTPEDGQAEAADAFNQIFRWMIISYPVLGLVMGWITGLLGAATYNLTQRLTGGLVIEIEAEDNRSQATTG